jgi:hypothetical protein
MKTWGRGGLEMAFGGKEASLILELRQGARVEFVDVELQAEDGRRSRPNW